MFMLGTLTGDGDAVANSESTPFNPLNCFAAGLCGMVVDYTRLSSPYGLREAPSATASSNHAGMDMAAPLRTPVYATAGGKVVFVGNIRGGGLSVYINHVYKP